MSDKQRPIINSVEAEHAAITGIANALHHAECETPDWGLLAMTHFHDYARTHRLFTTEEVRASLPRNFPRPPDARAWGAVARRAVKQEIVEYGRHVKAKSVSVHRMSVTQWKSKVFGL